MFVTVIALRYTLLVSQWSCGHFLKLSDSILFDRPKYSPFNPTHYTVLYPQNGDRIATMDSVTYNWYYKYYNLNDKYNTHTRLTALFPGLPGWAGTRKVKPIWILQKQETVSGSSISWAICKSAPRSRQITTPTNSVKALKALKWQMQMKSNCLINSEVVRKWWASCTWALTSVAGTCLAWHHHGTRRSATCRWPERTAWRPASAAPSSSDNSPDALQL